MPTSSNRVPPNRTPVRIPHGRGRGRKEEEQEEEDEGGGRGGDEEEDEDDDDDDDNNNNEDDEHDGEREQKEVAVVEEEEEEKGRRLLAPASLCENVSSSMGKTQDHVSKVQLMTGVHRVHPTRIINRRLVALAET